MHSPYGQKSLGLLTNTLAQPNINATSIRDIPFPLPPLSEQKAIVEKVNALMALCDQLEQEIQTCQSTREDWMKSSLRSAFAKAPADEEMFAETSEDKESKNYNIDGGLSRVAEP